VTHWRSRDFRLFRFAIGAKLPRAPRQWLRLCRGDAPPRKPTLREFRLTAASGHDVQALPESDASRPLLLQMLQHALEQTLQRWTRLLARCHTRGTARCRNAA
jgi:hypothetical protein